MNETTVGVHLLDLEAGPVEARTRMFGQDRDEFRARRGFFASENTIEWFFQKLIEINKKIMYKLLHGNLESFPELT